MEISKEAKNELKGIYLEQTGEQLTDLEVERMAQDLFCLFDTIYKPLPQSYKSNDTKP